MSGRPNPSADTLSPRDIADQTEARLVALIRFHDGMARKATGTEIECRDDSLDEPARRNGQRATAYRETAEILQRLLLAAYPVPVEFTGHLKATPRPKAQVRAPP